MRGQGLAGFWLFLNDYGERAGFLSFCSPKIKNNIGQGPLQANLSLKKAGPSLLPRAIQAKGGRIYGVEICFRSGPGISLVNGITFIATLKPGQRGFAKIFYYSLF
jgi:hypothetical protein